MDQNLFFARPLILLLQLAAGNDQVEAMAADQFTQLTALLRASSRIMVFTGAGISTGSGIPDFRGPQGVWKTRKPVYYQDFMTSEAARIEHWDYKLESWEAFRQAQPNATHRAIASLEAKGKLVKVVTQNIDGLHQKAGSSRGCLVELHGTNAEVECQSCHFRDDPDTYFEEFARTRQAQRCPRCEGFMKSATVSFGQNLRIEDLHAAEEAVRSCDLVMALGSSLSVHPAASFPLQAAERGVPYVIVNRGPTDHDSHKSVTLRCEGDVVEIFPPAVRAVLAE